MIKIYTSCTSSDLKNSMNLSEFCKIFRTEMIAPLFLQTGAMHRIAADSHFFTSLKDARKGGEAINAFWHFSRSDISCHTDILEWISRTLMVARKTPPHHPTPLTPAVFTIFQAFHQDDAKATWICPTH